MKINKDEAFFMIKENSKGDVIVKTNLNKTDATGFAIMGLIGMGINTQEIHNMVDTIQEQKELADADIETTAIA